MRCATNFIIFVLSLQLLKSVASTDTLTCGFCQAPQYLDASSEQCVDCPANSETLYPKSSSIDDCKCLPGFEPLDSSGIYDADSPDCYACAVDTYQYRYLDYACESCPAHSGTNSTGSTSNFFCDCHPGYGTTETVLGSYRLKDGVQCEECAAGKFGQSYRELMFQNGSPLPDFVVRSQGTAYEKTPGSGNMDGWEPDSACHACGRHQYAPSQSSMCFTCSYYSIRIPNVDDAYSGSDCRCPHGFQTEEDEVLVPAVSNWQINYDDDYCGRVQVESDDGSEWNSVDASQWNDIDAMVLCRALGLETGYAGVPTTTEDTLVKDVQCSGREASPEQCTRDTHAEKTAAESAVACCKKSRTETAETEFAHRTCTRCPAGSAYLLDQNLYTNPFPAASCTQCPVGKFSEAISVALDNSNLISPALHPNSDNDQWNWNPVHDPLEEQYFVRLWCKDCTTYDPTSNVATSDAEAGDASQCYCPVGYSGTISAVGASGCTACEAGKYRDRTRFDASNANHHICDLCGVGKYNANTASVSEADCQACKSHSTTENEGSDSPDDCVCVAGYFLVGNECQQCPQGKYKADIGNQACTDCVAGKYNDNEGSTSDVCQECDDGYFADEPGTDECQICPQGKYQDLTTVLADPADTHLRKAVECTACPSNVDSSRMSAGSYNIMNCECAAGYYTHDTYNPASPPSTWADANEGCKICPAGSRCPGYTPSQPNECTGNQYSNEGAEFCSICPSGGQIESGKRDNVDKCQCNAGYTGTITTEDDNTQCSVCLAGTYKEAIGTAPCDDCGAGKYSNAIASTTETNCVDCPDDSHTDDTGKTTISDCICDPGFYQNDGADTCAVCTPGYYCLGTSDNEGRIPCPGFIGSPPISNSPQGSDELVDCVCEPGYYENNPETGTCADCPANFYCNDDVRHPCPTPNTQSQLNSDDYTDCKCTQGYWRDGCTPVEVGGLLVYQKEVDGVVQDCIGSGTGQYTEENFWALSCEACPEDVYCVAGTMYHCPDHSTSATQSHEVEACICQNGFEFRYLDQP